MKTGHFRKILVTALAACLLAVLLLVPSFAETDAEKQLADATAAYNEAEAQSRKGTYGFFQWAGAENALKALDNAKYKNLIAYGTAGDATSLDNVEAALDLIDRVNEYREKEGLPVMVVTDTMMAMAEADADAFYDLGTAPKQFSVDGNRIAENLGTFANAAAAVENWTGEKAVADEHPEYMSYSSSDWYKVGHYYNLSQEKYVVTGAAVNTRLGNKFAQVYFSTAGSDKTYTTAEYRERINAYKASLEEKKQAMEAAQAAVQAEQAAATVTETTTAAEPQETL